MNSIRHKNKCYNDSSKQDKRPMVNMQNKIQQHQNFSKSSKNVILLSENRYKKSIFIKLALILKCMSPLLAFLLRTCSKYWLKQSFQKNGLSHLLPFPPPHKRRFFPPNLKNGKSVVDEEYHTGSEGRQPLNCTIVLRQ